MASDEFSKFIMDETEKWRKVIRGGQHQGGKERPCSRRAADKCDERRLTGWPLKRRVLPYHAVGCIVHRGKC